MSVSSAVAKVDSSPHGMIQTYKQDFAMVLPSHIRPDTFARLAQGLLRRDASLRSAAERNPGSFMGALLECARLGHEPGTDQYALTVFGGEVVGIEQYQGQIERIYRAGAVRSVKCEVVREHDRFEWDPQEMDRPLHKFNALADEADRGDLVGVYAYAAMVGGGYSQVVVMGKSEVMKHRKVAKTKNIWDGDFKASMWKKTAIHELEKWIPTSSEYRREQLRAVAEVQAQQQQDSPLPPPPPVVDTDTGEIHEAEIVE